MLSLRLPRHAIRDQRGFTLVEVLVAMVTGLIVLSALFAILDFSVKQSSRISESAQSTQRGRGTMTRIQDLLHSACISPKFTPVEKESTESKLILISGYSEKAEVPTVWANREETIGGVKVKFSEGARRDEIVWNESAKTLTDTYILGNGESSATYSSFTGTATALKIGEYVTRIKESSASEKIPIFKYYQYASTAKTGTGEESTTLEQVTPPAAGFSETEANKIAGVAVSFNTAPNSSETNASQRTSRARTADLTSMTTLAFSAPNAESTIKAGPCE